MNRNPLLLIFVILLLLSACGTSEPAPTSAPLPISTRLATPTEAPTPVATAASTATPAPSPTPEPQSAGATSTVEAIGPGFSELTDQAWEWISLTTPVEALDVDEADSYVLAFNEDGSLSITADCNKADGRYAVDFDTNRGGSLMIRVGDSTTAACPPGSRSDQFLSLLSSSARHFLLDERLHIDLMADGGTMKFAPVGTVEAGRTEEPAFVGTYQFRPAGEETADYFLVLRDDGTAEVYEQPIGATNPGQGRTDAIGTWTADGDMVVFEASEADGQEMAEGDFIVRIAFLEGFPVLIDAKVGDYFIHLDENAYSIGAGEQGPLVREIQKRLADMDTLGFSDPDTDVYDEDTRRAVVAFQQHQGLHPNGVVDEETWRALFQPPQEEAASPTPSATATEVRATTITAVNLRSGPGTAYSLLATVDAGTSFEVLGRNAGSNWLQVAYRGSNSPAWLSAAYATISGDLASVAVLQSQAVEQEPTRAEASGLPALGVPHLDDLSAYTEDGQPIVYFTFDDGPQPNSTTILSDLFDEYDGDATFFMVGKSVKAYPELVREATTKGDYIADHTWDHGDLAGMTKEQFVAEVQQTREAILEVAGDLFNLDRDVRYVRPPYASTDANTRQYAADLGMAVVLWSIDPQDWRRPGADVIANHILSHVRPGSTVLSHDGGGDRSQTIEAYRTVLAELSSQGYVFRNIFTP